jgi:phosphatidylglycerophosphatase C
METNSQGGKKKLALFDFDGTLTRKDTMFEFLIFLEGRGSLYWSLLVLSPILILTKLGKYDAEKAKKRLLSRHLKGMTEAVLRQKATRFCANVLPSLFRDEALEKLAFHRSKGHDVWIVTASLDLWVEPWLKFQNLPGLCTKMAFSEGVFQGEFASPNCNGNEKVNRIRAEIVLEDYERIYAYGDSSGDKAMFKLAHRAFYRRFI